MPAISTRYMAFTLALGFCALLALARLDFRPNAATHQRASSDQAIAARLDQLNQDLFWLSAPGASAALIRGGELTAWQGGVRRAWGSDRVGAHTQFEAASLSKPLTAYAILRLVRQGRLDLDAPITRGSHTFTLRQVLSHSAGFDNDLTGATPQGEAGRFQYAGAGYLVLGDIITETTGQSFVEHMNTIVLPELGMHDSQFGAREDADLALPSIDAGLAFALMIVIICVVAIPLFSMHALIRRLQGADQSSPGVARHVIAALSLGCGLAGLWIVFGARNWPMLALSNLVVLALAAGAWELAGQAKLNSRIGALICAGLVATMLVVRPALPLVERAPIFLPAAGLRTNAADYARFMAHVVGDARNDATLAQMTAVQAPVNDEQDWGLGLGLQRGETQSVWHWGVNFPGYQALAVADRQSGDVVVILLNGGSLSFSPSGLRYSGLEGAREVVADLLGGAHGGYWKDIQ